MSEGMVSLILLGILVASCLALAFCWTWAAGWNAAVEYAKHRDPMDPCWKVYR